MRVIPALILLVVFSALPVFCLPQVSPAVRSSNYLERQKEPQDAELTRTRQAVQAALDKLHAAAAFPGATVGFVLPDGRSASVATGLADIENKTPLQPNDRMPAGSIGKTFVATVAMQLAQEGRLNLSDKLERWFANEPWFARLPNAREINVRQLLYHASGIPDHVDDKKFWNDLFAYPDKDMKPEELLAYVFDKKPRCQAGKCLSYADTNYIVVGMIIEKITGKTLYSEISRRILEPLQLAQTGPCDRRVVAGVIPGYAEPTKSFKPNGKVMAGGKFLINPQWEWAGGGFASTAEDLARWVKFLCEGRVLDKTYLDEILKTLDIGKGREYGPMVEIRHGKLGVSRGFDGDFPGYLSDMEYFPQQKIAVAIQFNTDVIGKLKKEAGVYMDVIAEAIISSTGSKQ